MILVHESQKRLMHQRRRLQRVATTLTPEVRGGAAPQFLIDERHHTVSRVHISASPSLQQISDVRLAHCHSQTPWATCSDKPWNTRRQRPGCEPASDRR